MTYSAEQVYFYEPNAVPPVVWSNENVAQVLQDASLFKNAILSDFGFLYQGSVKARGLLNGATAGSSVLRVAGMSLVDSYSIGPAAARADGFVFKALQINYDESDKLFWFNSAGALVHGLRLLVTAHELSHLVEGTKDPTGQGNSRATDDQQNNASWDYKGGAVRTQNVVANQLGLVGQDRASYNAIDHHGPYPQLVRDYSYTNGVRTAEAEKEIAGVIGSSCMILIIA